LVLNELPELLLYVVVPQVALSPFCLFLFSGIAEDGAERDKFNSTELVSR